MKTFEVFRSEDSIPRSAILTLSLGAFGSGMSMRVMDPVLMRLSSDFEVSLGAAASVITVFAVAYGFSQLLFGPLGDRYGKYLVIAWASLGCAFTALLCGLASSFPFLLIARGLAGATAAAVIPLAMAWIGDVVAYEDRQSALARFMIGQIFGVSCGALVGGFSADYLGWRFPFFVIALAFFITGCQLLRVNRVLPARARVLHKAEGGALMRLVSEFRLVFAVSWARTVLLTVTLEGAVLFGALAFVPSHLHTQHGMSMAASGSLVMLFGMGGFLFALCAKHMVKRFGEVGLIRWGALIMGLSMLSIAYASPWWAAIPSCFMLGLGFYMMHNTLQINATQMAPERRGAAVAAFASCFFLGQSAGVAIAAALLTPLGSSLVLAAAGLGVWVLGERFARLRAAKPD